MAAAPAAAAPAPPKEEPLEKPRLHSSLQQLAACGETARVAALLDADGKLLGQKDAYGCDALSWAARNGRTTQVSALLAREADTAARGWGGTKPLHHAVSGNFEDIARELLDKGADINATDDAGNTPLHYGAKRGVMAICTLLVERKADVTAKNAAGSTPLHAAANSGQGPIVAMLLAKDADPNEADKLGNTPLHIAARAGFGGVVKTLLAGGAKPSANRAGKTPQALALDAETIAAIDAAA